MVTKINTCVQPHRCKNTKLNKAGRGYISRADSDQVGGYSKKTRATQHVCTSKSPTEVRLEPKWLRIYIYIYISAGPLVGHPAVEQCLVTCNLVVFVVL